MEPSWLPATELSDPHLTTIHWRLGGKTLSDHNHKMFDNMSRVNIVAFTVLFVFSVTALSVTGTSK